jgi:hypothetical protein
MERVHQAIDRHGARRRRQRLAEHLAAEHRGPAQVLALSAIQVLLDLLEREQGDQIVEDAGHGYSSRSAVPAGASSLISLPHPGAAPSRSNTLMATFYHAT